METMHIDRVDLNLTAPLVALLEERHVSRAADRVGLSQPAMSRALQRLRRLFDDPILIRDGHGFRRSPRADDIYDHLKIIIPHLEQLWTSAEFNPNEPEPPANTAGSNDAGRTPLPISRARLNRMPENYIDPPAPARDDTTGCVQT
jgi:DNA-binding transcriptional LysR family regulator